MRSDKVHLLDMLNAARQIGEFVKNVTEDSFYHGALYQSAVLYQLSIIGEAARRVSEAEKAAHPEIEWASIIGMRNRVTHEYFRVNLDLVWQATQNSIPQLIAQLEAIVPPEAPDAD